VFVVAALVEEVVVGMVRTASTFKLAAEMSRVRMHSGLEHKSVVRNAVESDCCALESISSMVDSMVNGTVTTVAATSTTLVPLRSGGNGGYDGGGGEGGEGGGDSTGGDGSGGAVGGTYGRGGGGDGSGGIGHGGGGGGGDGSGGSGDGGGR
jgi:hypothetical protein